MARSLPKFTPKRPHKLNAALMAMVLNGVHDRLSGRVFVLQVGAQDGRTDGSLWPRFREDGWSGLLIEPHPAMFAALSTAHKDSERIAVLNLGISTQAGTEPLHYLSDGHPAALRRKASLDRERIEIFAAASAADATSPDWTEQDIVSADIPLLRMDTVLGELGIDRVDVVSINAGGHEVQVLASFDLAALAPTAVFVNSAGEDGCVDRLQAAGLRTFIIGETLVGLRAGDISLPIDDLLAFFGKSAHPKSRQ